MLKTIVTFLFICFCIGNVYSQPYYFRHYQVEDGLTYSSVICSMQDSRGFMWFGTKDGLNRFDGYSFKSFQHNTRDINNLGSNYIYALAEDQMQNIWVGTSNGLYRYDPVLEKFILLNDTKGTSIIEIEINNKGEIWFISNLDLFSYNMKTKVIKDYKDKIEFATSITIVENESMWVSSGIGYLAKYDQLTDSFEHHSVYSHSVPALTNWIPTIQSGGENTILVGTQSQGLKIFNTESLTYKDVLTLDSDNTPIYVRNIVHYQDSEYWLATESGIFIYDLRNGLKKHLRKDRNDPFSLSDNAVYTLTKDKDGGIWAGTYFGGVSYFTKENAFFQKIFSRSTGNVLKNNAVRELTEDQYGTIWIGTEDAGLVKYEPKLDRFTAFLSDGKKGSISHNNIHGLLAIKDELWIGTFEQGLDILDIKSGKVIRNYKSGDSKLESNFIETLHLTKDNNIYIGASSGLYRYDRKQDDFIKIEKIPSIHLHSIIEDREGTLWIASANSGVYFFNPKTELSGSLKNNTKPNALLNNYINDLTIDSQDNLWITTENGLSKYNLKSKKLTHLSDLHNFPSNVFYKVLEANNKGLWISTSKGLIFMDPSLESWEHFTKNNGLLNDQFNYKSGYKTSGGALYFGSVKGLIKFDPSTKVVSNNKPLVYFSGFQISNQEIDINSTGSPLKKSILLTDKIILKPNQSTFSIDFAALSYASPQMTEYAYRMKGVEDDWVYLKTNRKVYFTNLSPGNYLFELKATTNSEWGEEVKTLQITIEPPFLASNLAFLFYFLLLVTVAYFVHKFNLKRLEDKNKSKFTLFENRKEREIYRAKLQFFTNITHEIRTPLTLIRGPLETAMKDVEPNSKLNISLNIMKKNTDRLILLTDQLLTFRKAEADNFTLSFVKTNVTNLLKESYIRFLPLAENSNCSFEIIVPDDDVIAFIDEEATRKILSNLFSNAIKYSNGEILITLEVNLRENNFKVAVKTDGEQIPLEIGDKLFEPFFRLKETENQSGTGIGLALARSLADLHGGKLILSIPEDNMNVFALVLPIHQNKGYELFADSSQMISDKLDGMHEDNDTSIKEGLDINTDNSEDVFESETKLSVLVVEDNIELIDFISGILKDNYRVVKAMNGEEAICVLKENTVNLIISDIMMPVMNGYDLCRQLKKDLEYSHIPIILLSAKGSVESKVDGFGVGADSYIEKPFSPTYLLAQAESLLRNRERVREYFARSPLVHIKTMAHSTADSKFLENLKDVIDQNLDNTNLDVEQLAWLINVSRPTLYRKIKAICDVSPLELITITRLKKAAELLVDSDFTINKIATQVGFSSQTQFTRNFVKQFDISPSKFRASKIKKLT